MKYTEEDILKNMTILTIGILNEFTVMEFDKKQIEETYNALKKDMYLWQKRIDTYNNLTK